MQAQQSNKAKIAKRVIEVLEFFDEDRREATVMDIVRRYKRPQSSTSELLSSLVDLGLLYKNPVSRTYTLTPRAAMLGSIAQPEFVRDGRMTALTDRLVSQTGLSVALFGMVGLNAQIFCWRSGARLRPNAESDGFCGGLQERLSHCAAGWLLLSTVAQPRRDGMVRRLNADASPERKFSFQEMRARLRQSEVNGFCHGPVGFGSTAETCAILLPEHCEIHPMAIGFVYKPDDQLDPAALVQCLRSAVQRNMERAEPNEEACRPFPASADALAGRNKPGKFLQRKTASEINAGPWLDADPASARLG